MSKYHIQDWAGNICLFGMEFNSFEDANEALNDFIEEFLDIKNDKDFEEEKGEYFITKM